MMKEDDAKEIVKKATAVIDNGKSDKDIVEQLKGLEESEKTQGNVNNALVLASVAAVFSLGYSQKAHAFNPTELIEDFAEKITDQLAEQFQPLLETVMGAVMGNFESVMGDENSKSTEALAKVGDAINQTGITIENQRLKRALVSRPMACYFDDNALLEKDVAEQSNEKAIERVNASSEEYFPPNGNSSDGPGSKELKHQELGDKLINPATTDAEKKALLSPQILNKDSLTPEELREAQAFIATLSTQAELRVGEIQQNENSSYGAKMKAAKQASKAAKIESAKAVFYQEIKRKDASSGQSETQLLKKQIDDSYYNEEWRKGIQEMAEPTPLLVDLCIQTATSNKLLYEMLDAQVQGNKVLATTLLDSVERS
ncbi:MAG: hypothetical protein HAW67_06965 [Endozoicomonadaceae bacterium]|nr:hypothetical protein [Endozoicomonadaceae bacterium]